MPGPCSRRTTGAAKDPAYEWEVAQPELTEYAFGIAAGLLRRGYSKATGDLVRVEEVRPIIAEILDSEPCDRDHNGGCQAHGYYGLTPGELCPQQTAKHWLETHPAPVQDKPGDGDLVCSGCSTFTSWVDAPEKGWKITHRGPDGKANILAAWCPNCEPWAHLAKD
ncbi:hypothetical protein SEA_COLUCCI_75 [Arthrobacter phage Colucci]|uniref:Uncharacterized protein n=1 Tax=Arthrobacter phage Colucci TaxID=2015834 RepID=A0A286N2Y7_9CAUD|nr:hypothetical protein FDI27_gp075 [Arthrobacter phage Colucci]ASX98744.1 hypothetical protein SEA_COLUCCI_75 [Arthrobacter phage Colucci]